jgi:hypothetical protein
VYKKDLAQVKRIASRKSAQAQVNASKRAHAKVWNGTAARFPGFGSGKAGK